MADIYLYTGESNPNDVRLRVFASIFLAIVGVAASPAIGQGSITATVPVSGVSGSAAIGVGSFNADFTISGVAAGATVGATRIDVSATLAGVAASPAIGTGTVETSAISPCRKAKVHCKTSCSHSPGCRNVRAY